MRTNSGRMFKLILLPTRCGVLNVASILAIKKIFLDAMKLLLVAFAPAILKFVQMDSAGKVISFMAFDRLPSIVTLDVPTET